MHFKYGMRIGCLVLIGIVIAIPSLNRAGEAPATGPNPAAHPLSPNGDIQPAPADRCPVCGMFPAKRPKSAAAMVLADGRTFYFCGNGCLLRTWRHPERRLNAPQADIARMVVHNYFSGASIDATTAWWVAGSDVVGPMGPAIVALSSTSEVDAFQKRHGGTVVFQLNAMTDALFGTILPVKKHK